MRLGRNSIPALALAGLLILLGHDALMAADPHGQPGAHAGEAGEHPSPQSVCHFQEGDRTTPSGAPDPQPAHPAIHGRPVAVLAPQLAHVSWMAPPGHPPDVIRALLQVFLN
jgi:hypothetical protein